MSYQSILKNNHFNGDWPRWSNLDYCECENVEMGTTEYSDVLGKMTSDIRGRVTRIVKVNCPYLYGSFLVRKAEYSSRGYSNCVRELFHATGSSNITSILKKNLDWRRVSRAKFGLGVSFSDNPSYANREAQRSIGSSRAMILADVLVGKTASGNSCCSLPPLGADTTTGNSTVFVKYYDDEFCPKYILYYNYEVQVVRRYRRHVWW